MFRPSPDYPGAGSVPVRAFGTAGTGRARTRTPAPWLSTGASGRTPPGAHAASDLAMNPARMAWHCWCCHGATGQPILLQLAFELRSALITSFGECGAWKPEVRYLPKLTSMASWCGIPRPGQFCPSRRYGAGVHRPRQGQGLHMPPSSNLDVHCSCQSDQCLL